MKTEKPIRESVIIRNDFLQEKSFKLNHFDVFGENNYSFIDKFRLFTAYFGYMPNLLESQRIDCKKARAWFEENHKNEIKDSLFSRVNYDNKPEIDDVFYFLYEDMLV
ncbi:MAG: hypothetical protein WCY89_11740, partial [Flavobacteriaceae bacterium]